MRWSATRLTVSLAVLMLIPGCGLFGKKKVDTMTADAGSDPYAPVTYDQPVRDYDPYSAETMRSTSNPTTTAYDVPTMTAQPMEPSSAVSRYHVVTKGDTLYAIARMYYGDQRRWRDVYDANRPALPDPNMIRPGQRLLIP